MRQSKTQALKIWWRKSLYGYSVPESDPMLIAAYSRYAGQSRPPPTHIKPKWWGIILAGAIKNKGKFIAGCAIIGGTISFAKDWFPALPEFVNEKLKAALIDKNTPP